MNLREKKILKYTRTMGQYLTIKKIRKLTNPTAKCYYHEIRRHRLCDLQQIISKMAGNATASATSKS